jgi:hypothetical protein
MHKRFFLFSMVALAIAGCTPLTQSSNNPNSNPKQLLLEDATYENEIKTVRLYQQGNPLSPAVTRMGQWNLMLDFDDLTTERDTYNARIIHCNYDWTTSTLQQLDFMPSFNEFPVNNSEFSVDTHIPYVHYWFTLPGVKLPGNYVVVVYRGTDKEDVVLSKRFMVYDQRVTFLKDDNLVGAGSVADVNQQLNFTVNHSKLEVPNPSQDIHVSIRQNLRWDNFSQDLKPSFVRDIQKEMEYHYFDEAKMFKGGNEFRFFDMRSLNYPGRNVGYVDKSNKPFDVYLGKDKSRMNEVYSQYDDLDGNFILDNYDYRDLAFSNYAYVNFSLVSPPINGDVYVTGAFNSWLLNRKNKMTYDSSQNIYKARILLKQGFYDYQYYVKSPELPPYHFEGSYFQTQNKYEVFIYYRPFQPRADLLVGYFRLEENPR